MYVYKYVVFDDDVTFIVKITFSSRNYHASITNVYNTHMQQTQYYYRKRTFFVTYSTPAISAIFTVLSFSTASFKPTVTIAVCIPMCVFKSHTKQTSVINYIMYTTPCKRRENFNCLLGKLMQR